MTQTKVPNDAPEERMRRMVSAFRAAEPTESEIRGARQRFLARQESRRGASPVGYLLATAVGAIATLLLVAAYEAFGSRGQAPVTVSPEAVRPTAPAGRAVGEPASDAFFEKNGARERAHHGMRRPLGAGESGAIAIGGSRMEVSGPGVIEILQRGGPDFGWQARFSQSDSDGEPPDSRAHPLPVPKRSNPAPAASDDTDHGAWARVATALRNEDSEAAERVLRQLSEDPDIQTRESAGLALAQLQVAEGRKDEAESNLRRLAETASAPIIRKRAADLLQQIE